MNNINTLIQKKYKKYNFTPLSYQEEIIKEALYNLLQSSNFFFISNSEDMKKYYISKIKKFFGNNFLKDKSVSFEHCHSFYVINIDVGLGKTITSIITAELWKDFSIFFLKEIKKDFFIELLKKEKELKESKLIKKELNLAFLQKFKEDKEKEFAISDTEIEQLKIVIVARKSISKEFENILKKNKDYIYSYMGGYTPGIELSINLDVYRDSLSSMFGVEKRGHESLGVLTNLFIVDEFGTDHAFFGNGERNSFIESHIRGHRTALGLTANKEVKEPNFWSVSVSKSKRYLKTDKFIRKELIDKGLYSGKSFFYKLIKTTDSNIQKFENYKERIIKELKELTEGLTKQKESILKDFNSLLEENSKVTIESFAKKYIQVKGKKTQNKGDIDLLIQESKKFLEETAVLSHNYQIEQNKILRSDFSTIFSNSNLQYLFDKNSILVLDDKFSDKDIKVIKEYFKLNEFNVLSINTYTNIKDKSSILIAKKNDLVRGLNLQMYDAIIFSYVEDMTQEEIFQGIGRLDRIGTATDKEIILFGKTVDEKFLEKFLEKKDEENSSLSLNIFNSLKTFDKETLKTLKGFSNINFEDTIDSLTLATNRYEEIKEKISIIPKKEKEKVKELTSKLKLMREYKKEFKIILEDIEKQIKESLKMTKDLLGGNQDLDFNELYLDKVLESL